MSSSVGGELLFDPGEVLYCESCLIVGTARGAGDEAEGGVLEMEDEDAVDDWECKGIDVGLWLLFWAVVGPL